MKRFIVFALLLFGCVEVMAQGSAPSPPQLWRRKGTSDTAYMVTNTGDTLLIHKVGSNIKIDLRGNTQSMSIIDSLTLSLLGVTQNVTVGDELTVGNGSSGTLTINNGLAQQSVYSFTGDGLQIVNGYLSAALGSTVEGSEITNQTIKKVDIDTTIAMVYASILLGTSASSDSAVKSKYYVDHYLAGYPIVGTPSASQGLFYDAGLASFTYASGGSGSGGDDVRIDQTLDNSDYVVGSTTYTGGFWDVSTFTMRGDTGLNIIKSGSHPGDTAIFRPDWARIQRNDGTQSIRTFRTTTGDTLLVMQDSSTYTKMTTSNTSGWKWEGATHILGHLYFSGLGKRIDSVAGIRGYRNYLTVDSDSTLYLNAGRVGGPTNVPVVIGSSSNWTLWADTLKGTGPTSQIMLIGRADIDTVNALRGKMRDGQYGIITSTDTALLYTRDTTNDTTTVRAVGKLKFTADSGLTEMDSLVMHGRLRMYDGTNKLRVDSASQVLADSLKTLPGGFLKFQGATSGIASIKASPTTTSHTVIWPKALSGVANSVLVDTTGAGDLKWSTSGAGNGNGSADFDSSTAGLDSNVLKGSGGTVLLDIHKSATPNVVIGKGPTMTSLIIGGNNSGLAAIDTSALIYNSLYFGNAVNKQSKIDSTFVYKQLKEKRYYFNATDIYWSPEKYNTADKMFLTWNSCDSSSSWPDNAYKSELFALADSVGDSHRPLNLTWNASERDTLLSFYWKYMSDSAAGTGGADTSNIMYPNYAFLYVNQTRVDSVFIGKTYASKTVDSINFADRQIAAGDVVTIMLWFETQVTSAVKRVRCDWAYLNMRRY